MGQRGHSAFINLCVYGKRFIADKTLHIWCLNLSYSSKSIKSLLWGEVSQCRNIFEVEYSEDMITWWDIWMYFLLSGRKYLTLFSSLVFGMWADSWHQPAGDFCTGAQKEASRSTLLEIVCLWVFLKRPTIGRSWEQSWSSGQLLAMQKIR